MRGASLTRGASVTGTAPAALGAAGWRADAGASTSTRSEPDARSFSQFASDTTASAVASATTVASVGWSLPGQLHPHVRCFSVSRGCTADAAGGAAGAGGGAGGGEKRMSLGEALNTLVDAAIEKVEAGDMDEAVSLLKEGLNTFEPMFPNSPELGELHNQAALLLLFQNKGEEAAYHAGVSLETTKRHFGANSILTGHRLLRLGVAKFVQGKMSDAAGLLREAYGIFGGGDASPASSSATPAAASADPGSRAEAGFYLDLVALAHCRDAGGVNALTPSLRANLRALKEAYGLESMILSLALAQHSRLTHGGLDQADLAVGEALMLQHIGLLTDTVGPDAEDVAVARYKLATYYYANDMLRDAAAVVKQAAMALRAHYPEEHDMLVLCRHRLGMICAAQGDHRSATQLLTASRQHFLEGAQQGPAGAAEAAAGGAGEGQGQNMLAKEADIGLAMARCRAVGGRSPEQQAEALESLRKEVEGLGRAIGEGHMLVQGASRYYTALSKMSR
eukprot:XP_001696255.1 predicted protein [Chlamydomonas reinhardtii]